MAKERANINTIYVGATNPPATKVLNKSTPVVDGGKPILDDITTDDSAAPEKAVVYANVYESIVFEQLVDTADPSYIYLLARAEDGASGFFAWRPEGDGTPKRQYIGAMFVSMKPKRDTQKYARVEWTLTVTGATTPSNQ